MLGRVSMLKAAARISAHYLMNLCNEQCQQVIVDAMSYLRETIVRYKLTWVLRGLRRWPFVSFHPLRHSHDDVSSAHNETRQRAKARHEERMCYLTPKPAPFQHVYILSLSWLLFCLLTSLHTCKQLWSDSFLFSHPTWVTFQWASISETYSIWRCIFTACTVLSMTKSWTPHP